jgi:hypothetical protein
MWTSSDEGDHMHRRRLAYGILMVALVLMVDGGRYSRAQELGTFHDDSEWVQFVHELVSKYYPNVSHELNLPDGYSLVFVLKDRATVLKHTALVLHEPDGTDLTQTISRIFPDAGIDPTVPTEQGSMCVKEEPGKHGRYCVMYAIPHQKNLSHK